MISYCGLCSCGLCSRAVCGAADGAPAAPAAPGGAATSGLPLLAGSAPRADRGPAGPGAPRAARFGGATRSRSLYCVLRSVLGAKATLLLAAAGASACGRLPAGTTRAPSWSTGCPNWDATFGRGGDTLRGREAPGGGSPSGESAGGTAFAGAAVEEVGATGRGWERPRSAAGCPASSASSSPGGVFETAAAAAAAAAATASSEAVDTRRGPGAPLGDRSGSSAWLPPSLSSCNNNYCVYCYCYNLSLYRSIES